MVDLYIYYEVREAHAAALESQVRAMQTRLAHGHAARAQLKRRPETKNGLQTWMEVYSDVDDGFVAVLEAAANDAGVGALIEGRRHTEIFTDLPPCA